jgi:hypothetical protein
MPDPVAVCTQRAPNARFQERVLKRFGERVALSVETEGLACVWGLPRVSQAKRVDARGC